jgi:hypothetical protein
MSVSVCGYDQVALVAVTTETLLGVATPSMVAVLPPPPLEPPEPPAPPEEPPVEEFTALSEPPPHAASIATNVARPSALPNARAIHVIE